MSPYRILPHTADLELLITAPSLKRLYAEALEALFDVMLTRRRVEVHDRRVVRVGADRPELVLKDLLVEGLHLYEVHGFAAHAAELERIDRQGIEIVLLGEPYDSRRHGQGVVVKAITYHHLLVEESHGTWRARVVVDL